MKTQSTMTMNVKELSATHEFSGMERYVLRKFHPVGLFIDTIGAIWCIYNLWEGNGVGAVFSLILTRFISLLAVRHVNPKAVASTIWGRIGLLHINPINLSLQYLGVIGLFWGVWIHSTVQILAGSSLILLGHVFGWRDVDSRLAMSEKENPYFQ